MKKCLLSYKPHGRVKREEEKMTKKMRRKREREEKSSLSLSLSLCPTFSVIIISWFFPSIPAYCFQTCDHF